jgi:hypothetical protein
MKNANVPTRMAFVVFTTPKPSKVIQCGVSSRRQGRVTMMQSKAICPNPYRLSSLTRHRTRLYHSSPQRNILNNNNNNNKKDDTTSIVGQVKSVAKKFLPSSWFASEDEKRRMAEQKQIQSEVQGSIQQLFRNAPLPIRMASNMIAPLFTSVLSTMAETVASQQGLVDDVYNEAVALIQSDLAVQDVFGTTIQTGRPFSQSSSSSSINGVTTNRIELAFPVVSDRLGIEGIGRLVATGGTGTSTNPTIESLVVQVNNRVINVNPRATFSSQRRTSGSTTTTRKWNNNNNDDDNIIDAEIIEKDVRNIK